MKRGRKLRALLAGILGAVLLAGGLMGNSMAAAKDKQATWKFDFGPGPQEPGYTQVLQTTAYTSSLEYGFADITNVTSIDRGMPDNLRRDYCVPTDTTFNVDLPNADYTVTIIAGDYNDALSMDVTAEGLSKLSSVTADAGKFVEESFTIALIDGQLNLAFSGTAPRLNALIIQKLPQRTAGSKPTVYIAGDSTVMTYSFSYAPQAGWGQFIADDFGKDVTFVNKAIGGRSSKTFVTEGRLDEILTEIRPNDYLFVQMGHNDATASRPACYTAPYTTYKQYLKMYLDGARQRQAIPVLITPMGRLHYVNEVFLDDFTDYCIAMLQLAKSENVKCIDLMTPSLGYYTKLGFTDASSLFMISVSGTDLTHFTVKGAKVIASMVASGIRKADLPISRYVKQSFPEDHPSTQKGKTLTYLFDFGPGAVATDYTQVTADTEYSTDTGYGLVSPTDITSTDSGTDDLTGDYLASTSTIAFNVDLPSGKYNVTVYSGNPESTTLTQTRAYAEGLLQMVGLGDRNYEVGHGTFPVKVTDDQLNLEFTGSSAYVNAIKIERDDTLDIRPTLFIAGDSTVANYFPYYAPQAGWGQMIGEYFNDGLRIDNHALGARSSKSYIVEGSLDTVLSRIKSGDFLMIQFGHNDASTIASRHTEPYDDYKTYLGQFIDSAREYGAIPILITPVGRRSYDSDGVFQNDFPDYCTAMKQVAEEKDVPLIDLMYESIGYYNSLGIEGTKTVFLWLDADESPNFTSGSSDNTHFKEYGARQIARLVAGQVKQLKLDPLDDFLLSGDGSHQP